MEDREVQEERGMPVFKGAEDLLETLEDMLKGQETGTSYDQDSHSRCWNPRM